MTPDPHLSDPLGATARQRLDAARRAGASVEVNEDALRALLRLAATPDHAADALCLLHELQVQQIELEMQIDELRRTRAADTA